MINIKINEYLEKKTKNLNFEYKEIGIDIKNCDFIVWHPKELYLYITCKCQKDKNSTCQLPDLRKFVVKDFEIEIKVNQTIDSDINYDDLNGIEVHSKDPLILLISRGIAIIWNYEREDIEATLKLNYSIFGGNHIRAWGFFNSKSYVWISDMEAIGIWNYETGEYHEYYTLFWNSGVDFIVEFLFHPSEKLLGVLMSLDHEGSDLFFYLIPSQDKCDFCSYFNIPHGGSLKYLENLEFFRQYVGDPPRTGDISPDGSRLTIISINRKKCSYRISIYDITKGIFINNIVLSYQTNDRDLWNLDSVSIQYTKMGERILHHLADLIMIHDSNGIPIYAYKIDGVIKRLSCHKYYDVHAILKENKISIFLGVSKSIDLHNEYTKIIENANNRANDLINTHTIEKSRNFEFFCEEKALERIREYYKETEFKKAEDGLKFFLKNINKPDIDYIKRKFPEIINFSQVWEVSEPEIQNFLKIYQDNENLKYFRGAKIYREEVKILKEIENLSGEDFLLVDKLTPKFRGNLTFIVRNNRVTHIRSRSRKLRLSESIGDLKSLTHLTIVHGLQISLSSLIDSLSNLESLKSLHIIDSTHSFLPESINKLQSLEILDLSLNGLSNLPESIGELSSLKELILSSNNLTELPKSLCNLKSLEKIYLDRNRKLNLPIWINKLKERDVEINY